MARLIDPPLGSLDNLPTPLTSGERRVLDLLDHRLPAGWEIYIQPYLNGLRPDFVLLHPRVGVAVFEIKDWDLSALQYYPDTDPSGRRILMARDKDGKIFSRESDNPVRKIDLYKQELFELYCPRLDDRFGLAAITAGVVFPCSESPQVHRLLGPFMTDAMRDTPRYYPITGAEHVASGDIVALFPESQRSQSYLMTPDRAEDLRGWLKEPAFSQEQRRPLPLDARQRDLATTRTATGYRRIKGPAGCGKSVVLAARAAELAVQGKQVLLVSFNITLLNYLHDLAVRHVASRRLIRSQVVFLNFHRWCRRVCFATGYGDDYVSLWTSCFQHVLDDKLPLLVQEAYGSTCSAAAPKYDAILVDEGQDFRPVWWQTLRLALVPDGEMVLVADKTQDIYGTAAQWTEQAMHAAGFSGPWAALKTSYRLPPRALPYVRDFAARFLPEKEADVPEPVQGQLDLSEAVLRWVHVADRDALTTACVFEVRRMMTSLRSDTAYVDITLLLPGEIGRAVVETLEKMCIKVAHTFHDREGSRRSKRAFFPGDARLKATTVHSFKGWEARHLVVCVQSVHHGGAYPLVYTALTRLREHSAGSCLSVVSSCTELRAYGMSWPDYSEGP